MKRIFAVWWEKRNEDLREYVADHFLDSEMIRLLWKDNPNIVFIPWYTTTDIVEDCSRFQKNFIDNFSITPKYLLSVYDKMTVEEFILQTKDIDLLYIWWGYPRDMLKIFKEKWIDTRLRELYESWVMLAWVSAWAVCWFDYRYSANCLNNKSSWEFEALWFVRWLCCPHFESESLLNKAMKEFTEEYQTIWYGIPDGSALYIEDNIVQLIEWDKKIEVYTIN